LLSSSQSPTDIVTSAKEWAQGWTEDTVFRRLISLIFADWLPHHNWFVGSCLCLTTRISAVAAL
jgi:hypothetical protein